MLNTFVTPLNFKKDTNGFNSYAPSFTNLNYQVTLSASSAQSLTVPITNNYFVAVFQVTPGSEVWIANGVTATLPSGTFGQTSSQMNPGARYVKAGDVLSFITSNTTADVGVSFYAV
jgi:hypothetical protein